MSELPDSWLMGAIADLVDVGPKNQCDDSTVVGFVPMNRMGKSFRDTPTFEARKWSEVKKGYTHFADGDVLVARITPCFENGKAGIARGLPNGMGAGSTEYVVLRPKAGVATAEYVLARLKTDEFLSKGAHAMTGAVGQQRVPKAVIESYPVPIAPFPEQQRISLKLTALLADVDACRERLDRVPQILKKFREAVLEAAVSGRLTEEWRESNDGFDERVETKIQSIALVGTGSTPLRSRSNFYSSTGTPWVTSAATSQPVVSHADEFVTKAGIKAHRLKIFPIGTLLVAMYGEGKTRGQVTELGIEATINQACAAIVVDGSRATKDFIKLVLQANYFQMRELAEGGNQPNLNLSKIREFPLSLPPIAEQQEVVCRVNRIFALASALQRRYDEAMARVEKLTPSVLAKAFRGELVPQDPNDEPAGEMLERMRQERVQVAVVAESRRRKRRIPAGLRAGVL